MFTFWKKKEKPVIKWWSIIDGLEKVVPVVPAKLKFTHTVKKCVDFRFCVQNAYMETEKRWYKWYKWYRGRKDQ